MIEYDYYLCGPMTGYPNHNYNMFSHTATLLRQMGFKIFNPVECNNLGTPYHECMKADLDAVINKCKGVAILPNWRKSTGANIEVFSAFVCGKIVKEIIFNTDDTIELVDFDPAPVQLPYYLHEVAKD